MSSRIGDETIRNVNLVTVTDPLLGQIVAQYKIESLVGSGAMGMVYRGVHQVIGKAAAIKVLKPDFADDEEMVQRLVREARTVNSIRHPAIVDIFDFGKLPRSDQPYIVMDLLEGTPLDEYMKDHGPLRLKEAAAYLDELLSALAAAHAVGVIHRDLKPGNIFVESKPDGQKGIKVIDFGLAKQADRAGGSAKPTNPGTLLGTPAFMAPEQVMGSKVSPVTDLYAVGGIAYQMLTNHLPHEGPTAIDVLSQKMQHDPIPPNKWQPWIEDELNGWIMNLLAREPEKRMPTADEARKALRRIIDGRTTTAEPIAPVRSASGKNPALRQPATGLVPKRDWGEAKTLITEPSASPNALTSLNPLDAIAESPSAAKASPLSTRAAPPDPAVTDSTLEPTAPPMMSPFQSSRTPAPVRLGPAAEPVGPVIKRKGDSAPTLPPVTLLMAPAAPGVQAERPTDPTREPIDSATRRAAEETDPAPAPAPSHLPLYVALVTTIVALLLGLAYLFKH